MVELEGLHQGEEVEVVVHQLCRILALAEEVEEEAAAVEAWLCRVENGEDRMANCGSRGCSNRCRAEKKMNVGSCSSSSPCDKRMC